MTAEVEVTVREATIPELANRVRGVLEVERRLAADLRSAVAEYQRK